MHQAATWILTTSVADNKAQPLFSINDPVNGGVVLGVNPQGFLTTLLSGGGRPPVALIAKTRVQPGAPMKIGLRLDGKTAAMFLNGRPAAEQPWEVKPQWYFHDVASPSPTSIFVGRGSKSSASRFELLEFRAHNVALTDEELSVRDAP